MSSRSTDRTDILLQSAKNYRKILSHISTFLQGLTNLLPRLGEYVTMFPFNQRLLQAIRGTCEIYLEACVYTAVYLNNRAWSKSSRRKTAWIAHLVANQFEENMLRGIFMPGTDYRDFADAVDKLEKYQVTIDREVQLALLQEHRGLSSRQIEDGQYERADRACTG